MMKFDFSYTSKEYSQNERQDAKDFFLNYIGDFKQEFDDSDVTVTINMDAKEYQNKYSFYSNKVVIGDLISKVELYRKTNNF